MSDFAQGDVDDVLRDRRPFSLVKLLLGRPGNMLRLIDILASVL